jgi:hypothetical protein
MALGQEVRICWIFVVPAAVQRPHGGYVQLWQDELLLIDASGQVIGCAHEHDDETCIQMLANA